MFLLAKHDIPLGTVVSSVSTSLSLSDIISGVGSFCGAGGTDFEGVGDLAD